MNMIKYIKIKAGTVTCFLVIMLFINGVLFTSGPLEMKISEIIYMDLIIIVISLGFFAWGYLKWRRRFEDIERYLENSQDISSEQFKDNDYYCEVIKRVVKLKDEKFYNKISRAEQEMFELNDYITKWVHEIKIPVSVLDLIINRIDVNDLASVVDSGVSDKLKIKLQLKKIDYLIQQVLYASRASSYQEDLTISQVNLEKLIRKIIRKDSEMFIYKNISIELRKLDKMVDTDSKWLAYIIQQVLSNSLNYTQKDGVIIIESNEDDEYIHISIKDNGIGIPQKDIDRIFDRGFSGDYGLNLTKSTGMGLYIVKKMCERLKYKISVDSTLGEYTEIVISIGKFSEYLRV